MSSRLLAGRYELLEKIGDGGMAVVYKGKDRLLNRFIAVKILRPEFTKDQVFVENFKRESQAAAKLSHPNIVGIYDVGREGNINYIVMELVNGRPLSDIIAEQAPMDYKTVIDITRQMASALKVAHKNKIIHRDIKPHNILVTEDGVAKLADFGIAKAVNDATLTSGSKVIGSVHYFSPEQARGNYVDERSDIYSLGIVAYEMLTGRVPFEGDNPVTVALKHINEEIVPPSEYVSGIPPALERAILKCTNKFQTNRFNSAGELLEELDNIEFIDRMTSTNTIKNAEKNLAEVNDDDLFDEDKKGKRKGKKKPLTADQKKRRIIIAVVAAVCLIPLIVFGLKASGLFSSTADVPDLKGMTYAEAKKTATAAGFKIKKGKDVYTTKVQEGEVSEQDPNAGDKAKKGSTITVNLSKGSKEGTVPNLVGMKQGDVSKFLKQRGYKLGYVKEQNSTEAAGTVLTQDPAAGAEAAKGTTINITVSDGKGKEKGVVPSLTGKTEEDAKTAIVDAGFKVGDITYETSNVYGKGYVSWQSYKANTELEKGTTISIAVSKGPSDSGGGGNSQGN